jgi:hypothetical protein
MRQRPTGAEQQVVETQIVVVVWSTSTLLKKPTNTLRPRPRMIQEETTTRGGQSYPLMASVGGLTCGFKNSDST